MLRSKHIGNLSSTARSFFLNGPRCNTNDGNSCTCADETCVSKKQQLKHEALHSQKPTTTSVVSKPPTRVLNLLPPVDAATKSAAPQKVVRYEQPIALPQLVTAPSIPSGKSISVNYASGIDDAQTSPLIGDQFFRAGIAAVNFLSDLVNYKLPLLDGSGKEGYGNCMVDPNRPISTVKTMTRVYPKSSPETSSVQNTSSSYRTNNNYKCDNSGFTRGKQTSNAPRGNSSESSFDKRKNITQRTNPNRFVSNGNSDVQTSNVNIAHYVKEGFSRPSRHVRMEASMSRQFTNTNNAYVVEMFSNVLLRFRWGSAAEEALRNLNIPVDPYQANQVLKRLKDHTVALGFFYWLKMRPGFKHDGHTYTTMVGILGREKQFGVIKKLLDQMVREGCQPNVVTYNRLIHSYGRANYLRDAMNVFYQMQEAKCEPDRVTYCTLIDIHAKSGFLDVALDIYQRMQAVGLSPDTFTYSVMINCLGKAGHLHEAHKLFCEMVNQGCVPNLVTYNIMIALHAKARNYENALKLYRDMQNAGFEPDKVTYSIVMEVLGHCGFLDEAERVFTEMKQNNWVPDEPVYGLLVDLWGKAGNIEKAWNWYQVMLHDGLRPNVPTCNSLLSTFLRVHRLSDAYNLLQSMLAFGLQPSLQTYTLLLSSCTEAQSKHDMGFCCQLMAVTGHPAHIFLQSMPSSGPDGKNVRDHVHGFLDLMHSEDRESKRGLVDAVVDFLHKTGMKEEAGSVWEVAAQKNVYPDAVREKSSKYWLINLHVMSEGTAITALSRTLAWFRRQMLASGVAPTRIDIVTGWGRRSRVTGTSMVRQSVHELLNVFSFPFVADNGNSGCFVGSGEPLNRWLLQSYVERMHLL